MTSQNREPIVVTGAGGPEAFTDPVGMPTAGYAPSAEEARMPVTPAYDDLDPVEPVSGGAGYRAYDEPIPADQRYAGSYGRGGDPLEGEVEGPSWGSPHDREDEEWAYPPYRAADPDRRGDEYDEPFMSFEPIPPVVGTPRRGEKVAAAARGAKAAARKAARFVVSKVPGKNRTAGEGAPTPPPAGGTKEAAPRPRTREEAHAAYKPAIERVARAKRAEESGAGLTTKDAKELDDSLAELRGVLDDLKDHEGWDDAKAIEMSILTLKKVGDRQIELSPDKVKVRFERARQVLGNILKSKKVRYILPAAIITAAVAVGVATGGVGAGMSAAIIGGAVNGGIIGGAVGGTIGGAGGAVQARAARAGRNTKTATEARVASQERTLRELTEAAADEDNYDQFADILNQGIFDLAGEVHRKNIVEKYKKIGGGVLRSGARGLVTGAIMGGAMGFAYHGLNGSEASAHVADQGDTVEKAGQMAGTEGATGTEGGSTGTEGSTAKPEGPTTGNLTPEQINEAQTKIFEELLKNDPDKIKEMPGFENFNPEAATHDAAAHFNDQGDYLWSKLQNHGDMSDSETWRAIVGDGPNKGGLEGLDANGVKFKLFGAEIVDGNFHPNGDTWGVNDAVVGPKGLNILNPDNPMQSLSFKPGHHLTTNELAATFDLQNHGGHIVSQDQLYALQAEKLAAQVPDTQEALKGMADSVITEYSQEISAEIDKAVDTAEVNPDVVESQVREAIEGYINEHGQALADLPENIKTEIAAKVADGANMTPEAIKKMIDDAIEAANAASNAQTQRTLASAASSM